MAAQTTFGDPYAVDISTGDVTMDPSPGRTRVEKGESMSGFPVRVMRGMLQRKLVSFMEAWPHDLKSRPSAQDEAAAEWASLAAWVVASERTT